MTTTENPTTVRLEGTGEIHVFMGRCWERGCRHGVRFEVPAFVFLAEDDPYGQRYEREGVPAGQRWVGGKSLVSPNRGDAHRYLMPECPVGHGEYRWGGLRAKVSASACDQVCAHATGEVCKCSCGGSNHGSLA